MNNSTIVSMIEEKLPDDITLENFVTGDKKTEVEMEKFSHLLELLIKFRERIEYKHSTLRNGLVTKSQEYTYNIQKNSGVADNNNRKPWCWLHPDAIDHPIWRCQEFQKKTHAERLSLVKTNGACYSCLGQGHTVNNCKRNFTCRIEGCSSTHHYLLHEAHIDGLSFHGTSKTKFNRNTLLQLQKIKGKNNNGKTLELNGLWDAGSTISFITFKKAKMLNLQGSKEHLQIIKVGGEAEDLISCRYKLFMTDLSEELVEVDVLGLEKISTEIKAIRYGEVTRLFHPKKLKDYTRPEGGEIDCLIGFDYAAFHPVMEISVGHLLLLRNRFGKIIGGRHPKLLEKTKKLVNQVTTYHIRIGFSEFYSWEQLGI